MPMLDSGLAGARTRIGKAAEVLHLHHHYDHHHHCHHHLQHQHKYIIAFIIIIIRRKALNFFHLFNTPFHIKQSF